MKQCFKNFLFKLNSKVDIYMSIYRYYIVWLQIQFKSGTIYNDQQISSALSVCNNISDWSMYHYIINVYTLVFSLHIAGNILS